MKNKAFIIHGWDGTPQSGWLPWMKRELEARGWEVVVPQLPHPEEPRIQNWIPALTELAGEPNEQTYFIGHSMGCQTIARYLENLPVDLQVGGAVFVAGFFTSLTVDEDPFSQSIVDEWLKTSLNLEKVQSHLKKSIAIFSDNDPYVPLENKEAFANLLQSEIIVEHNKDHYSGSTGTFDLPVALEALLRLAGEE